MAWAWREDDVFGVKRSRFVQRDRIVAKNVYFSAKIAKDNQPN